MRSGLNPLGFEESICRKVNEIIDSPLGHDVVNPDLRGRRLWIKEAFLSGELTEPIGWGDDWRATEKLANIRNQFGIEGIKATLSHVALDYIAELIKRGFTKEEIWKKLEKILTEWKREAEYNHREELTELTKNIEITFNQIFADVSREVKPSPAKIQQRKEFERIAKLGVPGVFKVDGYKLHSTAALIKINSKLKKGEVVWVRWAPHAGKLKREGITEKICNKEDLDKFITKVKALYYKEILNLKYSLVIEATEDHNFFGFYSPDLEGFTGVGHSIGDCIYEATRGMEEHIALLKERGLPIPEANPNPTIVIQNERKSRLKP